MCIIVYKPFNVELPSEETLRQCWKSNDDGAGIMYPTTDNTLMVKKGFMTWESFWEFFRENMRKEHTFVAHFRIRTHGDADPLNTHPFWLRENLVGIAHNGVLPISRMLPNGHPHSDTSVLVSDILAKLPDRWWLDASFVHFVEEYMGRSNKLVVMDQTGTTTILNKAAGVEEEGCWYSNSGFRVHKPVSTPHYPVSVFHDPDSYLPYPYGVRNVDSTISRTPSGTEEKMDESDPRLMDICRECEGEHRKLLPFAPPVTPTEKREYAWRKTSVIKQIWAAYREAHITRREAQQLQQEVNSDRVSPEVMLAVLDDLAEGVDPQEGILVDLKSPADGEDAMATVTNLKEAVNVFKMAGP